MPSEKSWVQSIFQKHEDGRIWILTVQYLGIDIFPALVIDEYCVGFVWVISFTATSMGLCFRFVLETLLIIQGYFNFCWAELAHSQGLSCFKFYPTSGQTGGTPEIKRAHSWDSWPKLTKGISYDVTLNIQTWRKKKEEGLFPVIAFLFPCNVTVPCFGRDRWIPAWWWVQVTEFQLVQLPFSSCIKTAMDPARILAITTEIQCKTAFSLDFFFFPQKEAMLEVENLEL